MLGPVSSSSSTHLTKLSPNSPNPSKPVFSHSPAKPKWYLAVRYKTVYRAPYITQFSRHGREFTVAERVWAWTRGEDWRSGCDDGRGRRKSTANAIATVQYSGFSDSGGGDYRYKTRRVASNDAWIRNGEQSSHLPLNGGNTNNTY